MSEALEIIAHTHQSWVDMRSSQVGYEKGFWLGEDVESEPSHKQHRHHHHHDDYDDDGDDDDDDA